MGILEKLDQAVEAHLERMKLGVVSYDDPDRTKRICLSCKVVFLGAKHRIECAVCAVANKKLEG